MHFSEVSSLLKDVPHTKPHRGKLLYDFVLNTKPQSVLELGTAHGVSACYMAAALDEIGSGKILTIDLNSALQREPNIFYLLGQLKLQQYVEVSFNDHSYNWELMKLLDKKFEDRGVDKKQIFDFCFIDGAHDWEVDGFAFFLVLKLLKEGAYLLFDDLYWTHEELHGIHEQGKLLTHDQKTTPHIAKIIKLLVASSEQVENVEVKDGWAWVKTNAFGKTHTLDASVLQKIYQDRGILAKLYAKINMLRKVKNKSRI